MKARGEYQRDKQTYTLGESCKRSRSNYLMTLPAASPEQLVPLTRWLWLEN